MKIGIVGLGKMGFNMGERLLEKGYQVVGYNRSSEAVNQFAKKGGIPASDYDDFLTKLDDDGSRIIWLMVPWKAVDDVLSDLMPKLNSGDLIVDGGNSPYTETVKRAAQLEDKGLKFIDVGVSGGPSGARNGACLMIGGSEKDFQNLEKLFADLSVDNGYKYVGNHGAGHFIKMVHNGIEYGMMQSLAEGFNLIKNSDFNFNLREVADIYNNGSVIESKLTNWLVNAYEQHGDELQGISGSVAHSGEGLWTVESAERIGVDVSVIKESLEFRKQSENNPSYTGKVLSALRNQFGGHDVTEK